MATQSAFVPMTNGGLSKPLNIQGGAPKALNTPQTPQYNPAMKQNVAPTPAATPAADPNKKPADDFTWGSTYGVNPGGSPYSYSTPFSYDPAQQSTATQAWGVGAQATGMPITQMKPLYGQDGLEGMWSTGPQYGSGEFQQQNYGAQSPVNAGNVGKNEGLYSSYMQNALDKMQGLQSSDYGLSSPIMEKIKVMEGQGINKGYDAQQEASKRMMQKMGIQDSGAALENFNDINQSRLGDLAKSNNNIDIENAKLASQQKLDTLSKLAGYGVNATQVGQQARQTDLSSLMDQLKLGENSRQFNITGQLDESRLQNDLAKFLETAGYNRAGMNEDVAQFLKNYDLEKLKMKQGLVGQSSDLLGQRAKVLPTEFAYGGY